MDTNGQLAEPVEHTARQLTNDLSTIGTVTCAPRLHGYALFDEGVMFGFVESDGSPYLRASIRSAHRFEALGGTKHREMPYWSIPSPALRDLDLIRELAYEAADVAHLAASSSLGEH